MNGGVESRTQWRSVSLPMFDGGRTESAQLGFTPHQMVRPRAARDVKYSAPTVQVCCQVRPEGLPFSKSFLAPWRCWILYNVMLFTMYRSESTPSTPLDKARATVSSSGFLLFPHRHSYLGLSHAPSLFFSPPPPPFSHFHTSLSLSVDALLMPAAVVPFRSMPSCP